MNKISSYLGFANKAKKLLIGQTHLKHIKQPIFLIMCCCTASQNLKDLAANLAVKHGCPHVITNTELQQLSGIRDVKILAVADENLAKAILKEMDNWQTK